MAEMYCIPGHEISLADNSQGLVNVGQQHGGQQLNNELFCRAVLSLKCMRIFTFEQNDRFSRWNDPVTDYDLQVQWGVFS